jgi:hypothetical protein
LIRVSSQHPKARLLGKFSPLLLLSWFHSNIIPSSLKDTGICTTLFTTNGIRVTSLKKKKTKCPLLPLYRFYLFFLKSWHAHNNVVTCELGCNVFWYNLRQNDMYSNRMIPADFLS